MKEAKQMKKENWEEIIQNDLDSGKFVMICSNESKFKEYVFSIIEQSRKEFEKEIERLENVVIGQKKLIASLDNCLELQEKETRKEVLEGVIEKIASERKLQEYPDWKKSEFETGYNEAIDNFQNFIKSMLDK